MNDENLGEETLRKLREHGVFETELNEREKQTINECLSEQIGQYIDNLNRACMSGMGDTSYAERQRRQIKLYQGILRKLSTTPVEQEQQNG